METAEHPTATTANSATELVLDRYRLVRRLGGGGFGVVWLAHDLKLDRTVAVKRIPAPDAETRRRAQREGVATARLSHPAIVALHEAGADDEAVYLVSELVRGPTFARSLEDGTLSDRDIVEIGVALCDALAHAHRRGVIHRDVKPLNILLPDGGDGGPPAKLTDFGVARIAGDDALTRTGDVVGTLAYMAPEQADGGDVDAAADLYALGLCLYEGLSGVNPVRARGAGATARRVGQRLPALGRLRRDLPLALCEAVDAAVWPDPERRGTVGELRDALAEALQDVDDEPGTVAGGPLEPLAAVTPPQRATVPDRVTAAALAAVLAAAVPVALGPAAGMRPWIAAVGAGALVVVLPRLGWVVTAAVLLGITAGVQPGVALLGAAAVLPVPLALRRAPGWAWSASAIAPALGLVGAALAFPAVAGQLPRTLHRAALGALGAWWVALAEPIAGRRLLLGAPSSAHPDGRHAGQALHVLGTCATMPMLLIAAAWAGAAVALPLLVRGRGWALDAVGATVWAAGLGIATQAAAGGQPRGLVGGAVVAGLLALVAMASRGGPSTR